MNPERAANCVLFFGKYRGQRVGQVGSTAAGLEYLDWLARQVFVGGYLHHAISVYLSRSEVRPSLWRALYGAGDTLAIARFRTLGLAVLGLAESCCWESRPMSRSRSRDPLDPVRRPPKPGPRPAAIHDYSGPRRRHLVRFESSVGNRSRVWGQGPDVRRGDVLILGDGLVSGQFRVDLILHLSEEPDRWLASIVAIADGARNGDGVPPGRSI